MNTIWILIKAGIKKGFVFFVAGIMIDVLWKIKEKIERKKYPLLWRLKKWKRRMKKNEWKRKWR